MPTVDSLSPTTVVDNGGDVVVATGTFDLVNEVTVEVKTGENPDVWVECYTPEPIPTSTTSFSFVMPPLARGGPYGFRFTQNAVEFLLSEALTVVNRQWSSTVMGMRRNVLGALQSGPRRLEDTDPLATVDVTPPLTQADLGGFAFAAEFQVGDILDPDNTAFTIPAHGDGAFRTLWWGAYSDKTTLSWKARAKITTAAVNTAGTFLPHLYQCANGDLIIACASGADFDIMATDDTTVLASVSGRTGNALYSTFIWRVAAGGDSLVWGPREVYFTAQDTAFGSMLPYVWPTQLIVAADESRICLQVVMENTIGHGSIDNENIGVGEAGWTMAGPPTPDYSVNVGTLNVDNFQTWDIRCILDMDTGLGLMAPSWDGPRPGVGSDSFVMSWSDRPQALGTSTHFATEHSYSSNPTANDYAADAGNADLVIPNGISTSSSNRGPARWDFSDGTPDWWIAQDMPGGTDRGGGIIIYGAAAIDSDGNTYTFDTAAGNVADNVTKERFATNYTTGADASWDVRNAASIVKLNATGQFLWQKRLSFTNASVDCVNVSSWINNDETELLTVHHAKPSIGSYAITLDPGGTNEKTYTVPDTGTYFVASWDTGTGEMNWSYGINALENKDPLLNMATTHVAAGQIQQRPVSGELTSCVQASFPASGYALPFSDTVEAEYDDWPGTDPENQTFIVHMDNAGVVTSFTRFRASAGLGRRVRFHAR